MLQILPLLGLNAFEIPKPVATPMAQATDIPPARVRSDDPDTVVVPAQKDGFDRVFIGQNAWYAIRISGGMIPKIKYMDISPNQFRRSRMLRRLPALSLMVI